MTTTVPAYTFGGITRPALILNDQGQIVLFGAAADFAATYGLKALYAGLPANTPYPPVTDSLSTPTDSNAGANSVAEGAPANTTVGITASASSASGTVTYSLVGDNSGGGFKINATTGVVTVNDPTKIDFESAPGHAYTINVQASDGIITSTHAFTIAVTDVAPSAPTDTNAGANSVTEGAPSGTAVGVTAHSTDVNGGAVTYSITGDTSGGGFKIDANTGVVTVNDATKIDFESSAPSHTYTVTVQASDGTLNSTPQTFTINVADVPLPAPTDTDATANTVAEGAAAGTHVGITASAIDPNGPTTHYSLTGDTSGGGFTIDPNTGVVTVADPTKIDFESAAGHAYSITVKADDGVANTSQSFNIAVTDVAPSAPIDFDPTPNSVTEGAAPGTAVGVTAHSTDVNGPAVTYSLIGDTSGGGFTINAATGVVTVADSTKIDFETAAGHAYTVTAQASDGTLASSQTFTIGVTDVAPTTPIDSDGSPNSVVEGAAAGTTVGVTASSIDVNGPPVTYSLIGDTSGGGFTINATTGVVTVADSSKIDYESPPGHNYLLNVQASDGTDVSSQIFSVAVTDAPPSVPVDSDPTANSVVEGSAIGTTVGVTAHSTDINGGTVTYSKGIDSSGGGFAVDATTGVITVADPTKLDFESSGPSHAYTVTVVASDGVLINSQNFTINVADAPPSTPVDTDGAANTVVEGAANGTTVGITASSTDVNGPAVTYSLTGDTSGGGFTINAATGVVTVADSTKIDFESSGAGHSYTVTATASDGTDTSSQTFTIGVTDAPPSTPIDSDGTANSVVEGAAAGTTVGVTASSTDVNGPPVTWSLTGDTSGGGFTINATTGVVTVADPTKIDFESTAPGHSYTVTATASDGTDTSSQTFTIGVTDAPPSTPVDADAAANTIVEGAANGSTVGVTASSTDVNGPAVTYSLTGDTSGGGFTINATTGVVTVADNTKIDFESTAPGHTYTVTATASDGTDASSQTFIIDVTDAPPSTPVDSDGAANQVAVSSPNGTYVGVTASSTDVNGPAVTYSLTGDTSGGAFTVNATTGQVTVADTSKILAADPSYNVTVQASDGTDTSQQTFTIAVVLDSAPVVTAGHTLNYTENQAATAIDPALTVTDSDNANLAHATVQITNNYVNGQDFLNFADTATITHTFDAASGTLTLTGSDTVANYQAALESVTYFNNSDNPSGAPRTVTIIANDGTLDSTAVTDTVNVTPVNDPPVVTAGHTLNYTENQAATAIDTAITVSDVDNTNLASATVQITGNYANGQDILGFTNTAHITGSFDAASGTLTLTGSDTVADYQAALESVTYFNNSDNPSGLARTVTIIANDGTANSTAVTDTINVTPVNDPPVTSAGGTLNYTENQAATVIDAGVTATDVDNANLASATVAITGGFTTGQDVLDANVTGTSIGKSYNAATGVLTLTGSDTKAHYQQVLDSVTYFNSSDDPSAATRTVSYTVNDGALNSNTSTSTVNVTPVNDAPVNIKPATQTTLEDTPLTFSTGNGNAISVNDVDVESGNLQVNLGVSHGTLTLSGTSNLTVTGNGTAAVQLTGTQANVNAALNGLVYSPALNYNNNTSPDTLTITTSDLGNTGTGGPMTDTDSVTINITPVNDAPSFTVGPTQTVTEDSGAHSVPNFATNISTGPADESGQTVNFIVSDNNAAMFSAAPSISSTGTLTYTTAANYAGTTTVTVQIHDNGGTANGGVDTSAAQTFIIDASPVADTPTFTTALTPVAFTSEVKVDTVSTGIQNSAAVAALLNGGYVVAWQDTNVGNTEAQIYDSSGNTVGSNFAVSDGNIDETDGNSLSINGLMAGTYSGGFLVVDQRQDASTGNEEIEGRIFSSTGSLSGPGSTFFQISPQVTGSSGDLQVTRPSSATFSDGSFVVAWEHVIDGNDSVIDVQRFNSAASAVHQNGTTAGLQQFQANTGSTGVSEFPDVAVLTNGNFVVTWDFTATNNVTTTDVFYQVYSSAGVAIGTQTEANTTTASEQAIASVAALTGGGFAISWTSNDQVSGTSEQDIYVRLFNAGGTATSGEILVDTTTTGAQDTSNIIALPDGGFLVTWDSDQDAGGSNGVFAQRFDSSGNKVGGEFEINQTTAGAQQQHTESDHDPQAILNNGKFVSVWDSNQNDGGDIFARQFTVPGDGPENASGIGLGAITALVTDLVGTTPTNGGQEIIDHLTLSGFPAGFTFSLGHAGSGGTWVIDQASDISAIASSGTQLQIIPTAGYHSSFTLSVTATVTDTAQLSTGDVTNTLTTSALTIPIGVKAPGDPIFAADSSGPFDLHLDPVAQGDTVSITSTPGNGQLELADGSHVAANAILTADQFAGLKFVPLDLGSNTTANLQFTVSDGNSETVNTVPITLVHGSGVTIDGSVANDHIIGSPGNDIINGGPGQDTLTGGGGADHFVFDQNAWTDATSPTPQIDHVTDYSAAQGDVLDVSALTSQLHLSNVSDASLVQVVEDSSGTFATLQVNITPDSAHWVSVAQLDGLHSGDAVDVLVDSNSATHLAQLHVDNASVVPAWTDHLSAAGDNFNFTPPPTTTAIAVPSIGGAPASAPAPSPGLTAPAGDSFHWAPPEASSAPALGSTFTLFYSDGANAPHISIVDPGATTITPINDSFNWPATDTHTGVVDTTVHDAVAPILPDPHILAATLPSIGGYIVH